LFSISAEVFASAAMFAAIAFGIAVIVAGRDRRRVLRALALSGLAYAIVAAVVLFPYALPAIRTAPPTSIHPPDHAYDDLLRLVLPRDPTVVGGAALRSMASRFTAASLGGGAYIGFALIALLVAFAITERRHRETWGLLGFILASALLTMGPTLHVAGDA